MEFVLLVHVLAGGALFGGYVYVESLMASAARTRDPETIMTVGLRVTKTNGRLFLAAGVITLISGTWIVLGSVYDFEMLFVTLGMALLVFSLTLGLFLVKPKVGELDDMVAEKGLTDPEVMAFAKSLGNLGHIQSLLVTIAIVLMVLKPGG